VKLAWNAIVKNEAARIERCLESLLPHIDCGVVVDTGSTDDTCARIESLFGAAGKPVEIRQAPFENFSQARNLALRIARDSKLAWDYALLVDADMELKVEKPDWLNGEGGAAYDMRQVGGGMEYWNRRLLARWAPAQYCSPTHEYLDVPTSGMIQGAYFIDHADGANRPGKTARDVGLLQEALKSETKPGLIQRYHFYLGQGFFELGQWEQAAQHYKTRVELGGWDEEVWYARYRYAQCLKKQDKIQDYFWEMTQAYAHRPSRIEPMYDLARFFRDRGNNHISLLFSEVGMAMPPSNDLLFVENHTTDLREEFAICAYYDERRRRTGGKEANKLALAGSEQARSNLYWYLEPLTVHVPSFKPQRISVLCDAGWVPMNPSVINHEGKPLILVRTVNYTITGDGQYRIRASDGSLAGDNPICTRNFIGSDVDGWREIALPENWSEPKYSLVLGFEDSRLFQWQGGFHTLSTVRELTHEGWCEQVLASLVLAEQGWRYGTSWRRVLPKLRVHEKNWMPWVRGDELCFVYRLGTLLNSDGEVIAQHKSEWNVDHISGGSQVVKIDNHTFLAIVHEARSIPGSGLRFYSHRFARLAADGRLTALSRPFVFAGRQIEFAAGLAYFPEKMLLMVSYGVRDCEAWTGVMDVNDVLQFVGEDQP
jgi:glycosyltransferase involved in cell wall biosynthesis